MTEPPSKKTKQAISLDDLLPRKPLNTYEGWRRYVEAADAVRPIVPTPQQWAQMSALEWKASATNRIKFHNQFPAINTRQLKRIHSDLLDLTSSNYRSSPGVRPGAYVDGLGTSGKSTIATEFGRKYERMLRRKFGMDVWENGPIDLFLPVVYVTVPAPMNIKDFNQVFLRFFGNISRTSDKDGTETSAIIKTAEDCGTSLIILDDIHFLRMESESGQMVNNHIKFLQSAISATFLLPGIDLASSGLLSEGEDTENAHISQTSHRLRPYKLNPFETGTPDFKSVLDAFEKQLCLVNQVQGSLARMDFYIACRTGGFLGSISQLLREGANRAIKSGLECLNENLLDLIVLDHASEEHFKAVNLKAWGLAQAARLKNME